MLQGTSPVRPGEVKRKFVSEIQKLQRDSKGSIAGSGDVPVGAGTRASNNQQVSSFSGLNLKQLIEEHDKISDKQVSSSSSSSQQSDEEVSELNENNGPSF